MIIIGIIFSYWLGFTVLVPGPYYIISIYEPTYDEAGITYCPLIQDANEIPKDIMYHVVKASAEKGIQDKIPKDIIEHALQHGTTRVIPPIEAHLFVSKLSDAISQHVIYGQDISACFVYNDLQYSVIIKFSFEPYIGD